MRGLPTLLAGVGAAILLATTLAMPASAQPTTVALLQGVEDDGGDVVVPGADAGAMLEFALAQLGKLYLWGAVGPDSYDCSGLVQTAYRAAGVKMPSKAA